MSQGLCLIVSECVAGRSIRIPAIKPVMTAKAAETLFSLNALMIYFLQSPPADGDQERKASYPCWPRASQPAFRWTGESHVDRGKSPCGYHRSEPGCINH